jgi:hypothetical protein
VDLVEMQAVTLSYLLHRILVAWEGAESITDQGMRMKAKLVGVAFMKAVDSIAYLGSHRDWLSWYHANQCR